MSLSVGLSMLASAALAQTFAQPDQGDFEYYSVYMQPLAKCVIEQRTKRSDITMCRGLVETLCQEAQTPLTPEVDCLLEEQFAWTDLFRATIPELIGVAEGKTMIASDVYITELSERFPKLREKCFAFSVDQIEEADQCQIDAAIQDLIWHLDLYDNGR